MYICRNEDQDQICILCFGGKPSMLLGHSSFSSNNTTNLETQRLSLFISFYTSYAYRRLQYQASPWHGSDRIPPKPLLACLFTYILSSLALELIFNGFEECAGRTHKQNNDIMTLWAFGPGSQKVYFTCILLTIFEDMTCCIL